MPMGLPTNIAMRISTSGIMDIGKPLKALDRGISSSVGMRINARGSVRAKGRIPTILMSHPAGRPHRHSLRNLCHTLVGGVIINMSGNCRVGRRLININFGTRIGNRVLRVDLNCSRSARFVLPGRIATATIARGGNGPVMALGDVSGRLVNRITTGVHSLHGPRPCGNGNVGFINRRLHHGTNGSTNTG